MSLWSLCLPVKPPICNIHVASDLWRDECRGGDLRSGRLRCQRHGFPSEGRLPPRWWNQGSPAFGRILNPGYYIHQKFVLEGLGGGCGMRDLYDFYDFSDIFVVIEVPQRDLPFPWQPFGSKVLTEMQFRDRLQRWLRCALRASLQSPSSETGGAGASHYLSCTPLTCPQRMGNFKRKVVFQPSFQGSSCIGHISEGVTLLDSKKVPTYTVLGSLDMSPQQVSHSIIGIWHQMAVSTSTSKTLRYPIWILPKVLQT